mmetsp:Transcript_12160/g.25700  ORF Transcript_12160/g.25700 Transcript_12160/m.25700 type:complete len:225 (-) Transcript_12160:282-956(-)
MPHAASSRTRGDADGPCACVGSQVLNDVRPRHRRGEVVLVDPLRAINAGRVDVKEESRGEHDVRGAEDESLEPIALPVGHDGGGADHGEGEHARLERREVEGERRVDRPRRRDAEGDGEQRDLRRRADGNADGELHLVLHREDDRGGVLGGVADDWEEDGGDKGDRNVERLGGALDGVDDEVGEDRDEDGDDAHPEHRAPEAEDLVLVLVLIVLSFLHPVFHSG